VLLVIAFFTGSWRWFLGYTEALLFGTGFHQLVVLPAYLLTFGVRFCSPHFVMVHSVFFLGHQFPAVNLLLCLPDFR
jgi:hypothetical protein